eukprot:TRINITY_DN2041_c0_g1_i1.p1 TRINITY_DN2041_c0_g1~~TRINITY_DN2041_c0_g1_i1.p1  ORF type:complete len:346 (+),score=62.98 TRINITY_DN2041_c0_g1_i1:93-1040(+)
MKQTQEAKFDWVLFGDDDEYLFWSGTFTLRSFLARFSGFSAVSLGKVMHTREFCSPYREDQPVDLFSFLYRSESGYCSEVDLQQQRDYSNCESYFGRRKYFVQPLYMTKLQIHEPILFEGNIVNLDTQVAHIKEIVGYNTYEQCGKDTVDFTVHLDQLPRDFHGDDMNAYELRNNQLPIVKDIEFDIWLEHLYNINPNTKSLFIELDSFQQYLITVFDNPCGNDVELVQTWDECGFGCAMTAYVSQILESYFRGETFTFGPNHLDYHRYFRNAFDDVAFPICFERKTLRTKPKRETMNPHDFFKKEKVPTAWPLV